MVHRHGPCLFLLLSYLLGAIRYLFVCTNIIWQDDIFCSLKSLMLDNK